jgi:type VI protein secretion system component VasK
VNQTRRPAPPPLEANDALVTAVITACWAVALIVLLIAGSDIPGYNRWMIWTCLAGFVMGLFGLWYVPRLKRARERAAARKQAPDRESGQPWPSVSKTVSSTDTPGRSTRS